MKQFALAFILSIMVLFITGCPPKPTEPVLDPTPTPQATATPISSGAAIKIFFIDVGQGDAEYLILPAGKTALIDGGPSNTKISAFLNAHSITHINYVVLTHPHSDHYQGLNWVFDNCQVDNFYDTRMNNTGAVGDETLRSKAGAEPNCTTTYPSAGETLSWDPYVTIQVLAAQSTPSSSSDGTTINDASIVLKITNNNKSVLFTGDLDTDLETSLVSTYGVQLSAQILKVAHHGSQYASSESFLSNVHPTFAYIEVGTGNTYGHPDASVLSRLTAAGATIYRTDLNGTLEYDLK